MGFTNKFLRSPAAASVLSLIAVVAFYILAGRANLLELGAAASWVNFAANLGIIALPVTGSL